MENKVQWQKNKWRWEEARMGYSICLSRMNREICEDRNPITLDEWLQVVEDDIELKKIRPVEGIHPFTKEKILIELPGNTSWSNYEENYEASLYYKNGKICTDDYDKCLIKKMKELAEILNARVLDDFDEEL
jgi:hypothetical protein